ncbi:MAG: polysaccharide deacetylase family protein [Endomicrobiia bacterium]
MKNIKHFTFILFFCKIFAEQIFYWKIDTKDKIIFLTFDDGPDRVFTYKVLDILDEYNIKATFFVLGELVKYNPEVIKEIVKKGHTLGNHTYYHKNYYQLQKKYSLQTCKKLLEEDILSTEKEVKKVNENLKIKYLRMPHGFYRKWMDEIVKKFDYRIVNWSFGCDWQDIPEEIMLKKYCEALQPGAIFLFHDGGTYKYRNKTINVLKKFIVYCLQNNYRFDKIENWIK